MKFAVSLSKKTLFHHILHSPHSRNVISFRCSRFSRQKRKKEEKKSSAEEEKQRDEISRCHHPHMTRIVYRFALWAAKLCRKLELRVIGCEPWWGWLLGSRSLLSSVSTGVRLCYSWQSSGTDSIQVAEFYFVFGIEINYEKLQSFMYWIDSDSNDDFNPDFNPDLSSDSSSDSNSLKWTNNSHSMSSIGSTIKS